MEDLLDTREFFPQLLLEDRLALKDYLQRNDLAYEDDIEYACCLLDEDGEICGCGCAAENILKCFALNEELRGQNYLAVLLNRLVVNRITNGIDKLFVFTKPENEAFFVGNGFYTIASSEHVCMLENHARGIETYLNGIPHKHDPNVIKGAIVMNCNPFTLGHRCLIENAAKQCDVLYVFVVQENCSQFSFDQRFEMVSKGTENLENVIVYPSGTYMISRNTFPTYFLQSGTDTAEVQGELDGIIFAERIAPRLKITKRFVGSEPFSAVTAGYNRALQNILPARGIDLTVMERKCNANAIPISASEVRRRLKEEGIGDWLFDYVPESTVTCLKHIMDSHLKSIGGQNCES